MRSINPRTGMEMTPNETIVYDALCEAASLGAVCPNYLDLNELIGAESSSTSPSIVKRLEDRGFIRVQRWQRFRQVTICATGESTMKSPNQKTDRPHTPRGYGASRSPAPSDRKPYKSRGR